MLIKLSSIIINLIALACAVIASIYYLSDKDERTSIPESKIVANILSFQNDTRWKTSNYIAWKPLKNNYPLQVGDSLYAGENSKIEIIFKNNEKLVLNSNTLLKIEAVELSSASSLSNNVKLNINYGNVEINSTQNTNWKIQNHKELLQIKPSKSSQYKIELTENKLFSVATQKGEIEVLHNGKIKHFDANSKSELLITEPILEATNPNTRETPPREDSLATTNKLDLKPLPEESDIIKNTNPINNEVPTRSHVEPVNKKSKNIQINVPEKSVTLSEVNNIKDESKLKNKEELNIKENSKFEAPEPRIPFHESTIHLYSGSKSNIHFTWKEKDKSVKEFNILLSENDLFNPVLIKKTISINKIDIELPNAGKYFWKIRSLHGTEFSPWSSTKYFTVEYSK